MFTEDEKRKKYNEEWYSFFENYHDLDLENKVNSDAISIYIFENSLLERSNLNFEHSYSDSSIDLDSSICKSPYKNFENKKDFFILKSPDNKIYCILGIGFLTKINKTFFGYIGELYKETNKQTTIFDFIDEGK